jgi:dipeptidyl aminopeptidase/acylaminoacyl peptidase
MSDTTRDTARYAATVARYQDLVGRLVGSVSMVSTAEVSPDGTLVAAILHVTDALEGRGHAELHVIAIDGGRRWQVTGAGVDAADPRWSLGRRLTFLADIGSRHRPSLFAVEVGGGGPIGEPERLSSPEGFPELHRPSADGRSMLLVVAGEHAEQADGLGSGTVGDLAADATDEPAWMPTVETTTGDDEWRSSWILDLETGDTRQVSPAGVNTWEADWLGGDAIVAIVTDSPAEDAWYASRLVRIGLDDGAVTTLHVPEWQLEFATGSPDGTSVAVIEGVASDRYYTSGDLLLVACDGSGVRTLQTAGDAHAARWLDDERLVVLGREGFDVTAGIAGTDGGWVETWRAETGEGGRYPYLSPIGRGGDFVTSLDGPVEPERLAGIIGGEERTLVSNRIPVHDELLSACAAEQIVRWTAPDGTTIEGLLRRPAGEGPFPTVLWVHGGPVAAVGRYGPTVLAAIQAEAGYATLHPNPRGSTGRGRAFAAAVVGDMGGVDAQDLLAGVEWLVAEGITDPSRIAVAGVSYGGYMAALLPARSDRFAAAIVSSPLTDVVAAYYASSLTAFVRDYIGGHPATDTARYVERSPVFAGQRLRTPTLITNGARDRATPMGQAVELFRALREQGTDAELVIYPTEGHGFSDVAARGDWIGRMLAWLERYMPADPG